jgi:hypothetical protein
VSIYLASTVHKATYYDIIYYILSQLVRGKEGEKGGMEVDLFAKSYF